MNASQTHSTLRRPALILALLLACAALLGASAEETYYDRAKAGVFLDLENAWSANDYLRRDIPFADYLTDNRGESYSQARVFCNRDAGLYCDTAEIEFNLGGGYGALSGVIYVPKVSQGVALEEMALMPSVQIYGDGALLFERTGLAGKDRPCEFSVDVSGVSFLSVLLMGGWYRGDGSGLIPANCVADLAVSGESSGSAIGGDPVYLLPGDAYSVENETQMTLDPSWTTDCLGNVYPWNRVTTNDGDPASFEYRLGGRYSTLTGIVYVPSAQRDAEILTEPRVQIYADGRRIYELSGIAPTDGSVQFRADVTGVEFVEIRIEGEALSKPGSVVLHHPYLCLANLAAWQ